MAYNTSSHELIELAFDAAHIANRAQIAVSATQTDIDNVHRLQSLDLGIVVPEKAHNALLEELAEHRRDFDCAVEIAGVVFGQSSEEIMAPVVASAKSDSPPPEEHALYPNIDFGAPIRNQSEVAAFLAQQSSQPTATRTLGVLAREGIATTEQHGSVDIQALYRIVDSWIAQPHLYKDLRGIGEKAVNLLAQYLNSTVQGSGLTIPNLPPKSTAVRQPRKQPMSRMSEKRRSELLLDTVTIDDETAAWVSCRGILRFARYQGENPQSLGRYWYFIESLAQIANEGIMPKATSNSEGLLEPQIVRQPHLAALGRHKAVGGSVQRIVWGFTPDLFRAVVKSVDENPGLAVKAQAYNDATKATIASYISELTRIYPEP